MRVSHYPFILLSSIFPFVDPSFFPRLSLLLQCFLDGKLLPSHNDVKIELMPEVSALMEYPLREMGGASSSGMAFANNMKPEPR